MVFSFIKKSGPVLSLIVVLGVFWILKLTGITLAEDAFCGITQHIHDETCGEKTLVCGLEESEPHMHTESCLLKELVCADESEEHTHTDACYTYAAGFVCGMQEADGHIHGVDCIHKEAQFSCGEEIREGHTHTDDCYTFSGVCTIPEHIHTESCYSDLTADIETADDWEMTLAGLQRSEATAENIAAVAKSQLGYTESSLNFQVDAQGIRRGITRYGQWYGNPYGDWAAMFASFCLYYAGADDLPANAGPESMRLEWEAEGLYLPLSEGIAKTGNLLFIDRNGDGSADSVAVIAAVDENGITVIEGDFENAVTQLVFSAENTVVMGYGLVPTADAVITLDEAAVIAESCTVWFDGTDGGIGSLGGSPDTAYETEVGATIRLPETWSSPSKYSYTLRGWYDITNSQYYLPGAEMEVTGDAVLYADWIASTYDIGKFNAQVADTVSTSSFITTHMFDYNYLFNIHSAKANISLSSASHSETWSMMTSGTVAHGGAETLDFIFVDNYSSGLLCMPNSRSDHNKYPGAGIVTPDIYSDGLGELLFATDNAYDPATGEGVLGKTYLGTGDHLFQIEDDPDDEHYGYYYYDSRRNAASYHQTNGRFYVYDYQSFTPVDTGTGFRFYMRASNRNYYMYAMNKPSTGRISATTTSSNGMVLTPFTLVETTDVRPVEDWGYLITNTPLAEENETSMTVTKYWDIPGGYSTEIYEESLVTVRLLANGVNTGRTATLSLKNNWEAQFLGLPYTDADGNVIVYTIEENWSQSGWSTIYGEVIATDTSPPEYSTTVTNKYDPGGPMLPSTGSASRMMYVLCGSGIMLGSLVYGIGSRRKRERRMK